MGSEDCWGQLSQVSTIRNSGMSAVEGGGGGVGGIY